MQTMVRYVLPLAGLLAMAGGSGCAGRQRAESPTARQVQSAQERSQQALDRAAEAQKKASEQGRRVAEAQQEVREAQRKLTEAQHRLENEQAKAEQLQQQAIEAQREAALEAQEAQREASRALSEQGRYVEKQQMAFSGQVTRASPDSVVVTPQVGRPMTFKVTGQTRVDIDGRRASAAEIKPGGDARVAYEMSGAEPAAVVIQVISGAPGPRPAPPP